MPHQHKYDFVVEDDLVSQNTLTKEDIQKAAYDFQKVAYSFGFSSTNGLKDSIKKYSKEFEAFDAFYGKGFDLETAPKKLEKVDNNFFAIVHPFAVADLKMYDDFVTFSQLAEIADFTKAEEKIIADLWQGIRIQQTKIEF